MTVATRIPAEIDGRDLSKLLARSRRRDSLRAAGLVAPLFVFLLAILIVPITVLLTRSFSDPLVAAVFPRTLATLSSWDGSAPPSDDTYAALVADLKAGSRPEDVAKAAGRLNYDTNGFRSLLLKTSTKLEDPSTLSPKDLILSIDKRWGDPVYWAAIKRASGPFTDLYLLNALDLRRDVHGAIAPVPADQAVFKSTIIRTFVIAFGVTIIALAVGFPFAYLASNVSRGWGNLLLFMVLLPFWTSILVRTLSWSVMLQRDGVINGLLTSLGLIDNPLSLMFNRPAVYIALVYVFLPFMVLPLYSVMRSIPLSLGRAAASLGASPSVVFRRVYLPQVMPGVSAGCLLVFIQSLGVYVTPSILGGPGDQGISYMIVFYVNKTLNWGLAAALSLVLLVATMVLYSVYTRLAGTQNLRMG